MQLLSRTDTQTLFVKKISFTFLSVFSV